MLTLSERSLIIGREGVGSDFQTSPGNENTRKRQLFYFILEELSDAVNTELVTCITCGGCYYTISISSRLLATLDDTEIHPAAASRLTATRLFYWVVVFS
jgi:hypothetical protein